MEKIITIVDEGGNKTTIPLLGNMPEKRTDIIALGKKKMARMIMAMPKRSIHETISDLINGLQAINNNPSITTEEYKAMIEQELDDLCFFEDCKSFISSFHRGEIEGKV